MFVVDACGHKERLVLLWHESIKLEVTRYSTNHVDSTITLDTDSPKWRFARYYGYLERSRQREPWQLLRALAGLSTLPWVIKGDYNDLLHQNEKRGHHPHPNWLVTGFSEAVADCGFQDFAFTGNQYTWERSPGTPVMVEEKLDHAYSYYRFLAKIILRCKDLLVDLPI